MNALGHSHRGPPLVDRDEAQLRQLDSLIDETRRAERAEAERRTEEARRQATIDAKKTYSLDELEQKRAMLAAEIATRQTHLKTNEEQELLRRRAARLHGEIDALRHTLANLQSELLLVEARAAGA